IRHRFRRPESLGPKDTSAIAVSVNLLQPANAPAAHEFTSLPEFAFVLATLLCAGLINAPVSFYCRRHRLAFANRHRRGLFTINIFPGFGSHHRHRRMPMGRSGNQHRINLWPLEHLTKICIWAAGLVVVLTVDLGVMGINALASALTPIPPDIADSQNLD